MRGLIVVAVLSAALAGCVQHEAPEVTAARRADADCKAQTFKTAVALAQCRNEAARSLASIAGESGDLLNVATAQRLVLAEKVDRRQITQAEADLEMARTMEALHSTEVSRNTQDRIARGSVCSSQKVFNTVQTVCN